MIKQTNDLPMMAIYNSEASMRLMSEWTRGWQAIAAELGDYTRRSFDDGAQTMKKLMEARTPDQALSIQVSYAKRAYDDYVQQMTKIGGMYTNIAKDAMKPLAPGGR